MPTRWSSEGEDAAAIAKAILAGNLDDSPQSFTDFFDPGGPGSEIGERYNYHTAKGKRNLKLNVLKLIRKVEIWKSNKPDPETGKRK